MSYQKKYDISGLAVRLNDYMDLAIEYKDPQIESIIENLGKHLETVTEQVKGLKGDKTLLEKEPDCLEKIKALRPEGARKLGLKLPENFEKRMAGAVIGRAVGCILGAIVEGYEIEYMEKWAQYHKTSFPPTDYWTAAPGMPGTIRYTKSPNEAYLKQNLSCCPVDDDIAYMLLGLLVLEQFGDDFTTADVGKLWEKHLPMAYTAEEVALNHLKEGVAAEKAGEYDNAYVQLIGADIRSDAWGYAAPGLPEKAAEMAYRDGYLSHRRNGLYGEMYFSAVISAAFVCDDIFQALEIGLQEIPANCWLADEIKWALNERKNIKDYKKYKKD
ncbi:MAG: ADP-ribosylglycohydrolase family protein, partial [Oscillospiraceae bacterium]